MRGTLSLPPEMMPHSPWDARLGLLGSRGGVCGLEVEASYGLCLRFIFFWTNFFDNNNLWYSKYVAPSAVEWAFTRFPKGLPTVWGSSIKEWRSLRAWQRVCRSSGVVSVLRRQYAAVGIQIPTTYQASRSFVVNEFVYKTLCIKKHLCASRTRIWPIFIYRWKWHLWI